jgi:hypothetical protein
MIIVTGGGNHLARADHFENIIVILRLDLGYFGRCAKEVYLSSSRNGGVALAVQRKYHWTAQGFKTYV